MPDEMKMRECRLYLVHYVPDLVREEFLNIGLFLHSPEEKFLGCLFTEDLRRVRKFHPKADLELLRELQQDFEQQIDEHSADLDDYVRWMSDSFSNLIQLAPPRTCLLRDPQAEIETLFERYVGPRAEGSLAADTRVRIKQRLTSALVSAGVWEKLEKRIPAERWTHPGDPFAFDYGYRPAQIEAKPNGHVKFIHALSLRRDADLAKVLVYTLERVQKQEPAQLTAVVESLAAPGDEAAALSQKILEERQIAIQPLAGIEEFAHSVHRELLMES